VKSREGANNLVVGFVVGAASWPPGVSGGLVAVLFGIYERLIDDITHLRTKIKEDLGFILTAGIGIILGVMVMAFAIRYAMDTHMVITMFLFVGLIVGQIPSLIKITKRGEPVRMPHLLWLTLGFAVVMFLLAMEIWTGSPDRGDIIDNSGVVVGILMAVLVGGIFAVSKIVPGISGSTVLLALGLFDWMNRFITDFDMIKLIPFAIGFVIGVFAFAKVMWYVLKNHHHAVYYFITGLTFGSVILILAITNMQFVNGMTDILYGCVAIAVGVVISLAIGMIKKPAECT